MLFSGIITALVTPFSEKGQLSKPDFLRLLDYQVQSGITQFVLASTTGESPVLKDSEVKELCHWFQAFKAENNLPLKLILATGSYSTSQAIEKTKRAYDLGADSVIVVTPYYNKPPQKGLLLHFEKVARHSSIPLILYNVPSRTACCLEVGTIKKLSQIDNIIGIKEATGDMDFLKKIQQACPKNFLLLSGDDMSCMEFFNLGGHGTVSALANVLAKELMDLFKTPSLRLKNFRKYKKFVLEVFREINPIGVKQALNELGVINSPQVRLPLVVAKNPKLSQELIKLKKNPSVVSF